MSWTRSEASYMTGLLALIWAQEMALLRKETFTIACLTFMVNENFCYSVSVQQSECFCWEFRRIKPSVSHVSDESVGEFNHIFGHLSRWCVGTWWWVKIIRTVYFIIKHVLTSLLFHNKVPVCEVPITLNVIINYYLNIITMIFNW